MGDHNPSAKGNERCWSFDQIQTNKKDVTRALLQQSNFRGTTQRDGKNRKKHPTRGVLILQKNLPFVDASSHRERGNCVGKKCGKREYTSNRQELNGRGNFRRG